MIFKKLTFLFFATVVLFSCSKNSAPTPQQTDKPIVPNDARWKQMADLTIFNTISSLSFTIDNKGYVLNEEGQVGATVNLWAFDAATGQWTKKAPYPGLSQLGFSGFVANGKAYIGTGLDPKAGDAASVVSKEFYEYDPTADKWTKKADFPGLARVNGVAFSINGAGYMGIGTDATYLQKFTDMWRYDIAADNWTKIADYPGAGQYLNKGFSAGSRGYVGMGLTVSDKNNVNKDFWQYNPANNTWTKKADFLGVARVQGVSFSIDGTYYLGLGAARNELTKDVWKYNDVTDTWLQVTNYPDELTYGPIGFAIGNAAYVGGGASYANGSYVKHFWQFKL